MIELSYRHLNNKKFIDTLVRVSNTPLKGEGMVKEIYNISRMVDKVQQESKKAYEVWQKALAGLEFDEVGAEGQPTQRIPKDKFAFTKAEEEFLSMQFTIERHKIPVSVLEQMELSAQDLLALEPIVEGLEQFNAGGENG
jgi:hypothetical protein